MLWSYMIIKEGRAHETALQPSQNIKNGSRHEIGRSQKVQNKLVVIM